MNLGSLGKGRSPSQALNRTMRSEASWILGKNLYLGGVHVPTWSVRADGPSRGRKVDPPRTCTPFWLAQALKKQGIDAAQLDKQEGLPRAYNRWFFFFWALLCCTCSVAEAPRPSLTQQRTRNQLERGRVTATTSHLRAHLLEALEAWLEEQLPHFPLGILARHHPSDLSDWLEEYMTVMYVRGDSRRNAAETLNALTQKFGWLRTLLTGPWNVVRTWESLEPVEHHPPMPLPVARALIAIALAWNWCKVAVLLGPSEFVTLRRQDVALPDDHFEPDIVYVRVGQPKTRHRATRCQHVRVEEPWVATWINAQLQGLMPWKRIWHGSLGAFRSRFDLLQQALLGQRLFMPASLRPGGATYYFRLWNEDLVRLQWKGRWRSFRMLEIYVQELGAAEILVKFSVAARQRTLVLAGCFLDLLRSFGDGAGRFPPTHP